MKRFIIVLGLSLGLGSHQLTAGPGDAPTGQVEPTGAERSSPTARTSDGRLPAPMEQRYSAVGERIPSLKVANGRVLRDVEIVAVTDAGIEVRHSSGAGRVRCEYLPADWWVRFGWSVKDQAELLAAERQQAARLEQRVATKMKLVAERENQRQQEQQAARRRARESVERVLASATASAQRSTSPLQQPPRRIGRPYRSRYPYHSNGYYGRGIVRYRWVSPSRRSYSSSVSRSRVSRCSGVIVPAIAPVR